MAPDITFPAFRLLDLALGKDCLQVADVGGGRLGAAQVERFVSSFDPK